MRFRGTFETGDVEPLKSADLTERLDAIWPQTASRCEARTILVAVSGGPDSLALLALAADLDARRYVVRAATVDHGLRPEAAAEARHVAAICRDLRVPHRTLPWRGWTGRGNLQAAARNARYDLVLREARRTGAGAILTAHHLEDQLETVLHAISRGDGAERRAGMRETRELDPRTVLLRPFLSVSPARLHAVLGSQGLRAIEDPSNLDDRFARVRHRRAIAGMSQDERDGLLATMKSAARLRAERDERLADAFTQFCAEGLVFDDAACAILPRSAFATLDPCVAAPLLARLLTSVGGAAHGPRRENVDGLLSALREGETRTLNGARASASGDRVIMAREFGRDGPPPCDGPRDDIPAVFDRRFEIAWPQGQHGSRAHLGAYGTTGRGDARTRTLPCLFGGDGTLLAAHGAVAAREERAGRPIETLANLASLLPWRCLADLPERPGFASMRARSRLR
ncbi:tRNA lysidine(34) synthetase TilS [Fulvimarina endophytica]|uniref:tRNA lysidine(34) synthetase TilS n=1 Tax=Fulvimarina endophytica TaxID=2293836 RepID=UPI0013144B96|nr:tRNA lysidine(34) synthetase TilS [Fulvimarina endophytica]